MTPMAQAQPADVEGRWASRPASPLGHAAEVEALSSHRAFSAAKRALGASGPSPLARPEGGTLASQEPYAQAVARLFNLDVAQTVTTATLRAAQIAVTRLTSETRGPGLSSPLPIERAYVVALQLQDAVGNQLWRTNRPVPGGPFTAGSITIANLEDQPVFNHREAFDCLLFHIPQIAFDELADDHGARRISEFSDETGAHDPVVFHLGRALLPCFEPEASTSRLFFDHVAFAIHARLAARYGRLTEEAARRHGGLTAWQERAAKDALVADLGQEPCMADVARACSLSVGRLIRGFRQATGMPPHRWLRAFRVERAKDLLLTSNLSLAQVAYECGFADQSHFTRVFAATIGTSPGAWRRGRCG
jgi:AraC family transcriptional regulator